MLNEKGQIALEAVCSELREVPDGYDQSEWGVNSKLSCSTPSCVAGYIVATMKCAQAGYERRIQKAEGEATRADHENAIRDAATETLGLKATPRLFDPQWPREWIKRAGGTTEHAVLPHI